MKTSILIPAYNAGATIDVTINAIKSVALDGVEIIVVNDGSRDNTSEKANQAGVKIIELKKNRGKGQALNAGAQWVNGEIVVLLDADLKESAAEFIHLLKPIKEQTAQVTVAKFPPAPVLGGLGLVKALAAYGIFCLTGQKISNPLSGQRAMEKKVFLSLLPFSSGFGVEVGATVDILKRGWIIKEVDLKMSHDYHGRSISDFLHRGRQFFDILGTLLIKVMNKKNQGARNE